jgi:hypothetical protein
MVGIRSILLLLCLMNLFSTQWCPRGQTSCEIIEGGYGCCKFENAVCCSDKKHCCPHGETCDLNGGSCKKGRLEFLFESRNETSFSNMTKSVLPFSEYIIACIKDLKPIEKEVLDISNDLIELKNDEFIEKVNILLTTGGSKMVDFCMKVKEILSEMKVN